MSENEQNIEVSIIMPSYNKYPLNLFSLYSLENQTFDHSKMEVIFIDDASTDQTQEELQSYRPPFHYRYIRNEQNLGRAKVRNLGIQSSRGKILIFLDAEMLCEPDFVRNHYMGHQENEKSILTGIMHSENIITCIYPENRTSILPKIVSKKSKKLKRRLKKYDPSGHSPFPILKKSDIPNQSYKDWIVRGESWYQNITQRYGQDLTGFQFPWMAFLTGNVSISKNFIVEAGLFDEEFIKYGYEDWELGYRLYKLGGQFFARDNLATYHQEHSIGENKRMEAIENFALFLSKHPDIDVMILGLELARITDLYTMNKILYEYKRLTQNRAFKNFQVRFAAILEAINLMLQIDVRHISILKAAGYGTAEKEKLAKNFKRMKSTGDYPNLCGLINDLFKN
ncbi:glycosyltransferase [Peribacillus kribbensis]|uniref:glycosyltransferase n=1 Tax=Peribacillus kribbensis TaxID=356658 RepID=UPI000406576B|nr:glycosyltransferase [Peribacillus kribbensis]